MINEPEQFWAEQARRIDWQTPLRKRSITAIRRLPVGFVKANQLVSQRYRPLAGETARGAGLIAVSSETEEERTFTFRQLLTK